MCTQFWIGSSWCWMCWMNSHRAGWVLDETFRIDVSVGRSSALSVPLQRVSGSLPRRLPVDGPYFAQLGSEAWAGCSSARQDKPPRRRWSAPCGEPAAPWSSVTHCSSNLWSPSRGPAGSARPDTSRWTGSGPRPPLPARPSPTASGPYGTRLKDQDGEDNRLGSPLRVHRRCAVVMAHRRGRGCHRRSAWTPGTRDCSGVEDVADLPPVHQVAAVEQGYAGEVPEAGTGEVVVVADPADARVGVNPGMTGLVARAGRDWSGVLGRPFAGGAAGTALRERPAACG